MFCYISEYVQHLRANDELQNKEERKQSKCSLLATGRRPKGGRAVNHQPGHRRLLPGVFALLLCRGLCSFVGFGPSGGLRRVGLISGSLDHTFHESQLSDGELHLLSGAGWVHENHPAQAGAQNYRLRNDYTVYLCSYAQQMTGPPWTGPPSAPTLMFPLLLKLLNNFLLK